MVKICGTSYFLVLLDVQLESFRFGNEGEYEIPLKVFACVQKKKKKTLRKASFYLFSPKKLVRVIYSEGGKALSR